MHSRKYNNKRNFILQVTCGSGKNSKAFLFNHDLSKKHEHMFLKAVASILKKENERRSNGE